MNLRRLECFVAVARHLSFSRAAVELGMAQPPLSQHIQRLERELGTKLFSRSKRRVELTDVGRAFLPRARALVQEAQLAHLELMELLGIADDTLRVGASGTLAAFLLPDLVAEFSVAFPNVGVRLVQHRSEAVLRQVEKGDLDIGLLRLPLSETSLETTPLRSEPLFVALPPTHEHAGLDRISLAQLKREPFIMCVDKLEPFYAVVTNLCAAAGFTPRVICAGAEYTTVFRLVGMGVGVTVASELATRLTVDPSPVFVQINDPAASITTVMVARPKAQRSGAAMAFHALVLRRTRLSSFDGAQETAGAREPEGIARQAEPGADSP